MVERQSLFTVYPMGGFGPPVGAWDVCTSVCDAILKLVRRVVVRR